MTLRFGSVCSGIEAASVAWEPLGWHASFLSEIEGFPSAVLAHHYPNVPNRGDMTRYEDWPDDAIDLLVGGTPCQSFSVAGLRQGLADPRGNLMLTYLAIARRYQPRWLVWENVPGVLSSADGRDFGTFIRGLEECGYHAAWRVLDAQYIRVDGFGRAVPQRRRRVFVVGYLGDWRYPASVLLEREGMQGDPAPRRQAGERVAPTISSRPTGGGGIGTDFDCDGGLIAFGGNNCSGPIDVATACQAHGGPHGRQNFESETFIAHQTVAVNETVGAMCAESGPNTHGSRGVSGTQTLLSGYIQPVAFAQNQRDEVRVMDVAGALAAEPGMKQQTYVGQSVAFDMRGREGGAQFEGPHETANIRAASGGSSRSYVAETWAVRRLMPIECERLQGFPDGYTNVPWRKKSNAPDGPRYKALGNSMAVNVMRWIGRRIDAVERLSAARAA